MENNNMKFTKMRYAFATMEPTSSNIMSDYETTRDDILQHIYPVLVHESRVNSDTVALRINGITGLKVVFMLLQTRQLLSKTTQLKYRIKPSDLYWSSFLVTLCSEIMLYIETPLVSYSYSLNEVSHSCTS